MVITSGFTMAAMVNRFFAWKLVKVDEIKIPGMDKVIKGAFDDTIAIKKEVSTLLLLDTSFTTLHRLWSLSQINSMLLYKMQLSSTQELQKKVAM